MNTELRPTNAFYREIGNFSIFNARIGVQAPGDLSVSLFVNNVLNKYGINRVASATGTPDYYVSTRPRTIGINLHKGF